MSGEFFSVPDQAIPSRVVTLTQSSSDTTTSQTSTSASYTDLATTGPSITLSSGVTQNHWLTHSSWVKGSLSSVDCYSSIAIAGAGAQDVDGAQMVGNTTGATGTRIISATSIASGSTHTMKYKVGSGTGTWAERRITGVAE